MKRFARALEPPAENSGPTGSPVVDQDRRIIIEFDEGAVGTLDFLLRPDDDRSAHPLS